MKTTTRSRTNKPPKEVATPKAKGKRQEKEADKNKRHKEDFDQLLDDAVRPPK